MTTPTPIPFEFAGEAKREPSRKPRPGKWDLLCADVRAKLDAAEKIGTWLTWKNFPDEATTRSASGAVRSMDAGPGLIYRTRIRGEHNTELDVCLTKGARRKRKPTTTTDKETT